MAKKAGAPQKAVARSKSHKVVKGTLGSTRSQGPAKAC